MMKPFCLFTLLLANISMYAMDNVRIVPFEYEKHMSAISSLNLFQPLISMDGSIQDPAQEIKVLVKPYPATRSKRPDTVLGALAHQTVDYPIETFTRIKALEIVSRYQGKGYGRLLMQHIEKPRSPNKKHCILLLPITKARPFYKKLGYVNYKNMSFYLHKELNP